MKKEFAASWYDERYKVGGHKQEYFKQPEKSIYYPVWSKILDLLDRGDIILEVGCGPGQLAKLILDEGYNYVKGFDFSKEAIGLCKKFLSKTHHSKFNIGNVYDKKNYQVDYNTVICCEVFEHLDRDIEVLDDIKSGSKIIFTVPNFNSKSHVRYFKTSQEVVDRYSEKISMDVIEEIYSNDKNKIYLINGIKK